MPQQEPWQRRSCRPSEPWWPWAEKIKSVQGEGGVIGGGGGRGVVREVLHCSVVESHCGCISRSIVDWWGDPPPVTACTIVYVHYMYM